MDSSSQLIFFKGCAVWLLSPPFPMTSAVELELAVVCWCKPCVAVQSDCLAGLVQFALVFGAYFRDDDKLMTGSLEQTSIITDLEIWRFGDLKIEFGNIALISTHAPATIFVCMNQEVMWL
ncbi:hypothetical protein EON64_15675 [archaeon]|nr:MAG: hypothetical protein EON64_15675 [archaeon]